MPRATTKDDLLATSGMNYAKLMSFIDALPEADRERDIDLNGRDRNVRDVVCHLHEWHLMLEGWRAEGMKGKTPAIPGAGYTWRTLPALNREIWKKYQATSLKDGIKLLKKSYSRMMKLIEGHSERELWKQGIYAWTKSTTLGAYFVSNTASHYDWALKTLKPLRQTRSERHSGTEPAKAGPPGKKESKAMNRKYPAPRPPLSDPAVFPSEEVLAGILGGRAKAALDALLEENRAAHPTFTSEWRYYNDGKRWLMKGQVKQKTVFWLSAATGSFRVTYYLGAGADAEVMAGDFSEEAKAGWKESTGKKFRGLTISVKSKKDLPACRAAADLKLSSK